MRAKALISSTIGGLVFGFAAASTSAQQPQPAGQATVANETPLQGSFSGTTPIAFQSKTGDGYSVWVRICEKGAGSNKEICVVNTETIDTNTGLTVIAAGVRKIEGDTKEQLFVTLPQTALLSLPAGVQVNVDGSEPVLLTYGYCYGMNCEAQAELGKELLGKLRKGKQLTVTFVNLQGQALALPVNLAGFAKAYDGPSADVGKYQEARAKLIQALSQRQAEPAAQASQAVAPRGEGPSPSQPQPVYPGEEPPN
jgi:invasion protein IalB